jgi:hypothetical protein
MPTVPDLFLQMKDLIKGNSLTTREAVLTCVAIGEAALLCEEVGEQCRPEAIASGLSKLDGIRRTILEGHAPTSRELMDLYIDFDLLANRFRRVALPAVGSCWSAAPVFAVAGAGSALSAEAIDVARDIHESDDYKAAGVLGDFLQDHGCTNPLLLGHLQEDEHHRGCWAVNVVRAFARDI